MLKSEARVWSVAVVGGEGVIEVARVRGEPLAEVGSEGTVGCRS